MITPPVLPNICPISLRAQMDSSTWNAYEGSPPVVNIFEDGHWRAIAVIRLTIYIFLRATGLFYVYHAVRKILAALHWLQRRLWQLLRRGKIEKEVSRSDQIARFHHVSPIPDCKVVAERLHCQYVVVYLCLS